jgi:YD repeat-containing protein
MKITYDAQVDALYIQFLETTVTTVHLAEGIAADYDAEGRLAGIEILAALQQFDNPEVLRQVILEDVGWRWPESVINGNSDTSSVVPA